MQKKIMLTDYACVAFRELDDSWAKLGLSAAAKEVLLTFFVRTRSDGLVIDSVADIAKFNGCSRQKIQKGLNELRLKKLITLGSNRTHKLNDSLCQKG
jgi:hypothetical protein